MFKSISVADASGKIILKDGFAGKQHSINVNNLKAGVYFLKTTNALNETEVAKFIKQ